MNMPMNWRSKCMLESESTRDRRQIMAAMNVIGLTGREHGNNAASKMAQSLGWLGVGLGLTEIVAPRAFEKMAGITRNSSDSRLNAVRKIATGIGTLAKPQSSLGFWTR